MRPARPAGPAPIRCTGPVSYSPQPERFSLPALDVPPARAPFPARGDDRSRRDRRRGLGGDRLAVRPPVRAARPRRGARRPSRLPSAHATWTAGGRRAGAGRGRGARGSRGDAGAARARPPRRRSLRRSSTSPARRPRSRPAMRRSRFALGSGDLPDEVEFDGGSPTESPAAVLEAIDRLRTASARLTDAPVVVDARDGIGILGPPLRRPRARPLARPPAAGAAHTAGLDRDRLRGRPGGSPRRLRCDRPAVLARTRRGDGPRIERPRALAERHSLPARVRERGAGASDRRRRSPTARPRARPHHRTASSSRACSRPAGCPTQAVPITRADRRRAWPRRSAGTRADRSGSISSPRDRTR